MGQISFDEANKIIHRLGGDPFQRNGQPRRTSITSGSRPAFIRSLRAAHQADEKLADGRGMVRRGLERSASE
jgi:hypothetical protein